MASPRAQARSTPGPATALAPRAPRALVAAGLALLLAACGDGGQGGGAGDTRGAAAPPSYAGHPLVLVSLDTCRADALSSAGGRPQVSPTLDALAAESVVFEHARAQAPHTAPSHMSLFTSQYPSRHGVQNVQFGDDPATGRKRPLIEAVPAAIPTLAEVLSGAGYRTVGLTDGGNLNAAHGFPRGFDEYTLELSGVEAQVDDGLEHVRELAAGEQPWFLFWHTYEIHAPYVAPEPYLDTWVGDDYQGELADVVREIAPLGFQERWGAMRTRFWAEKETFGEAEARYLRELYDAGVRYTDDHFARLVDGMREAGVFDEAIVIITSDHGEEFHEHGGWQHDQLYEEALRVPLMVRLPGGRNGGTRIRTPVALLDLMPTILELLEIDAAEALPGKTLRMQGRSLVPSLLEGREPRPRPIFSEVRSDREGSPLYDWQIAIHNDGWKFLIDEYRGAPGKPKDWRVHELYDLAADPGERRDLAAEQEGRTRRFLQLREGFKEEIEALAHLERVDSGESIDEADLEMLIRLGYVEDTR